MIWARADFLLVFSVFDALTAPCYEYTVRQKPKNGGRKCGILQNVTYAAIVW
jgi:hypothetical protein